MEGPANERCSKFVIERSTVIQSRLLHYILAKSVQLDLHHSRHSVTVVLGISLESPSVATLNKMEH